jgi:hypothetical protein
MQPDHSDRQEPWKIRDWRKTPREIHDELLDGRTHPLARSGDNPLLKGQETGRERSGSMDGLMMGRPSLMRQRGGALPQLAPSFRMQMNQALPYTVDRDAIRS